MAVELFHNDMSTCSQKVRLALAEKGIEWTGVELDLRAGDQHQPGYLSLNANGVVPTIRHDGTVVIESTVINEYLEETLPEPPMLPTDPAARAYARQWIKFVDARLFENNIQMTHVVRDVDRKQSLCREILKMVPMLDDELRTKSSKYFLGDDLSLVDAVMAPTLRFVPVWSAILDDETWHSCTAAQAYLERLSEHPSISKRAFAAPIGIYEDFYRAILVDGLTVP